MAQDTSAFALDTADPTQATNAPDLRKKRLSLYGLQNLASFDDSNDQQSTGLQEQPLHGGDISRNTAAAESADEPSLLDTSRVKRAPVSALEAQPLLGGAARAGNVLTGEEGQYGPLSTGERSASLRDFFRPSAASFSQNIFGPNDPGTAFNDVQQAKKAYGYANTADQATGGNARNYLTDYLKGLFGIGTGLPGVGAQVSTGLGPVGSDITGFGDLPPVGESAAGQPAGFAGGAGSGTASDLGAAAGAEAGAEGAETGAGTAAGTAVGGATGVLGLYSLMSGLYRMLAAGGEGPTSGNQWADLGFSLVPGVGDVLKEAVKGAFMPSQDWRDFGGKLEQTLGNENSGLADLIAAVENAKTRGDLTQATELFRHHVGGEGPNPGEGYVGGYALGPNAENGAPQIGGLPGATGTQHEWGINADFSNPVNATNQLLAALYGQLPEGEATPLSQNAFNYRVSNPEWDQYQSALNEMLAGGSPDLSAYRPQLRDLITSDYAHQLDVRRQQALADSMAGSMGVAGD